jgi:hypothetical protein
MYHLLTYRYSVFSYRQSVHSSPARPECAVMAGTSHLHQICTKSPRILLVVAISVARSDAMLVLARPVRAGGVRIIIAGNVHAASLDCGKAASFCTEEELYTSLTYDKQTGGWRTTRFGECWQSSLG